MSQENPSPVAEPTVRTRSGRVSKLPERYVPIEQVEDDYADDDYDSHESDVSSEISYDESEEENEEDDDADENGNLDGFVVSDKSESDSDDSDGEPAIPIKKRRAPVKKRPVRK